MMTMVIVTVMIKSRKEREAKADKVDKKKGNE